MNLEHWRLATGIAVTGLLYAVQHWAPWPRKLTRLEAYTIGTATLWIGLAIWMAPARVFWISLAFPAVAGLSVGGSYLVDRVLNWRQRADLHNGPQ